MPADVPALRRSVRGGRVIGGRLAAAAVGAFVALAAVVAGAALAEATTDPPVWPQVTRCEVVQPEDLDPPTSGR